MIDIRKINMQKAICKVFDSTPTYIRRYEQTEIAFKAGINWFLDNLWHRCNEIPRNDYSQVVLIKKNNQASPTILDMNDLMDNSEGKGDYERLWKGIVKTHQIKKWFYIDDLLKGEK